MTDRIVEKDAVIIGAGISGLATGFHLQQAGLDVLVLEKSECVGGAIHTGSEDGFLIDYGPNSTLDTSPKISKLIEKVDLQDDRVYANEAANRRYVLRDGQLTPLPMSPLQFMTSKLFSAKAKLRLLVEPFIKPAPPDKEETIAEFVERRLGREFLDYAINPFVAGVYAGDPTRLSVQSAVKKIYALERDYGSLIKGAIKGAKARKQRAETAKDRAKLFSFKKGMGQLPQAIANTLGDRIETRALVKSINRKDGLHEVDYVRNDERISIHTKSVIFTTPAFVTATYLALFDPNLAEKLDEIVYAPVALVFIGYKTPIECRALDGFGFLVPEVEKRKILGTIWISTIFPNRAPENGIALTTFVGGMRQPELIELSDEELSNLVLDELKQLMEVAGKPDVIKIKRWPRAIPQYELGHQKRIEAIERFESEFPGIFISGNFRNGISVGDCIVQAEEMAESVQQFCESQPQMKAKKQASVINQD